LGAHHEPVPVSARGGDRRIFGLVAEKVKPCQIRLEQFTKCRGNSNEMNSLLVAAIVLAALSGVLYWSNHKKTAASDVKVSSETPPKILTLSQADITKVEIKQKSGADFSLAKNDGGKWEIQTPKPLRADQNEVSSMLSTLSSLNSERLIDEKAGNLAEYGLAQPAIEVHVTDKDNKSQKLLIGDSTPTGNAAYVALAAIPRVFTLASYNKTSLTKARRICATRAAGVRTGQTQPYRIVREEAGDRVRTEQGPVADCEAQAIARG
jgi:hypothetical protein